MEGGRSEKRPVSREDCRVRKIEVEGRHENAVMMIPYLAFAGVEFYMRYGLV